MPGAWHGGAGHRAQMRSNVIALRTNGLVSPGGPIGAAAGRASGATSARPGRQAREAANQAQISLGYASPIDAVWESCNCCVMHAISIRPRHVARAIKAAMRCTGCKARPGHCVSNHTVTARDGSKAPCLWSGKKASVIDAITRRADPWAGLPVLILINPNNPILHPVRSPDCNCGATLVRTGMCVHVNESRQSCGGCRAACRSAYFWYGHAGLPGYRTRWRARLLFPSNSHFGGTDGDAPV
jgi:hypothetical protein